MKKSRSGDAGSSWAVTNHGWRSPQWFSVRSPMMRIPRSCTARASEASASSPPSRGSTVGEARGVVAVDAPGREDRREVEDVGAERLDVVEALLDPGEVAAEPLARRVRAAAGRQLVPGARDRPIWEAGGRVGGGAARREAVGEDLVHDRAEVPVRAAGVEREDEVVGVGRVVGHGSGAVEPHVVAAVPDKPAVAHRWCTDRERGPPPGLGIRLGVDLGRDPARLAVLYLADCDRRCAQLARHAHAHGRRATWLVGTLEDVELRAVVVARRGWFTASP